jgi:hypothetical protein
METDDDRHDYYGLARDSIDLDQCGPPPNLIFLFFRINLLPRGGSIMPIPNMFFLAVVIAAFAIYMGLLFWVQIPDSLKARSDDAGSSTEGTVVHVSFDRTTEAVDAPRDSKAA